jgi:2-polyprenyl-3-methyl-5-hydroxy-6-metoxy-1,4-benzoquinol methylase
MTVTTDLEARIAKSRWFHAIDFGDVASSGRFKPGEPQNVTLYGTMDLVANIDLTDAEVLDIGAADGLVSFGAVHLGAKRVVATDSGVREGFVLAREALGLDVEYAPQLQLKDLVQTFGRGSFDLIVCCGVIYHMLNPASAFFECRKLVKEQGLVIFESAYDKYSERAAIFINSEEGRYTEPNTYSIPTRSAILGLMRLACFDILAVRTLSGPPRITVLGRAVAPEMVRDRTDQTRRIHEIDLCDFDFQIKRHLPSPQESTISYRGDVAERTIDHLTYEPDFPFHPPRHRRSLGNTAWNTPDGNC